MATAQQNEGVEEKIRVQEALYLLKDQVTPWKHIHVTWK